MIGLVRAATLCVTLALGLVSVQAADKAFKRDDLVDSAIKLEAQIKSEAGPVTRSAAPRLRTTCWSSTCPTQGSGRGRWPGWRRPGTSR